MYWWPQWTSRHRSGLPPVITPICLLSLQSCKHRCPKCGVCGKKSQQVPLAKVPVMGPWDGKLREMLPFGESGRRNGSLNKRRLIIYRKSHHLLF